MYRSIKTGKSFQDIYKESITTKKQKRVFQTTLEEVDSAIEWYEDLLGKISNYTKEQMTRSLLVFSELYMNAFEHGNLRISAKEKGDLLKEDTYLQKLQELQKRYQKSKIEVTVCKMLSKDREYIVTKICDEGDGFDAFLVIEPGDETTKLNGRGILMSQKNCIDIFYNTQGNCVLFLNEEERQR